MIEPLLPNKPRGVPRVDDRRVLNGIFWVLRSGAPWRDLPERYGPRTTCYNRFVRWRKAGVWDRLMDAITAAHDGDIQMIDSTSIRAHQQAATAKRGIEIIVSVAPEAGSRPKSTRSSMGKAFRIAWVEFFRVTSYYIKLCRPKRIPSVYLRESYLIVLVTGRDLRE